MARVESSVTSLSWIPMDAMQGVGKLAVDLGIGQWDLPPPDRLERLDDRTDTSPYTTDNPVIGISAKSSISSVTGCCPS